MKALILLVSLLGILVLGSSSTVVSGSGALPKERATIEFTKPVTLQGVVLKGEYLFVHDDAAMARGEACTFVYKGDAEISSKLVVSFHCTPAERNKVSYFTVRTLTIPNAGIDEITEFQFAGSTEAHMVPTK